MAKIRRESTPAGIRYVVDGRYQLGGKQFGQREFFTSRDAADGRLAELLRERVGPRRAVADPKIRLGEFMAGWLRDAALYLEPATLAQYTWAVGKIPDYLAAVKVRDLDEQHGMELVRGLASGDRPLARKSIRHVLAAIHAGLQTAVGGLLARNPLDPRSGKSLIQRFAPRQAEVEEAIRPLTRPELDTFVAAAGERAPRYLALWFTMSRTGMRPGEGLGLQWGDLDFLNQRIRIARSLRRSGKDRTKAPKNQRARTVPMSRALGELLARHQVAEKARWLKAGKEQPAWVFPSETGLPMDAHAMFRGFRRVCERAGLPAHSPYDLRHTFATLLLEAGKSIKQVAEWLGHSDIRLAAHTYGRWAKFESAEAIDQAIDGAPEVGSNLAVPPAKTASK